MKRGKTYTSQLGHGQGAIEETRKLLNIWEPGMEISVLFKSALDSGNFPQMSARRLRNFINECFAPRFLANGGTPALWLKKLVPVLSPREFEQLLFVYACRASTILADFVAEVYWKRYSAGQEKLTNQEALAFVARANQDGLTAKPWSDGTIERVTGYLTGTCADFGLLENGPRSVRRILPFRIESRVVAVLAYDLHFAGQGDNALVEAQDWKIFGLERLDVVAELKRLSLKNLIIVQAAGDAIRIGWKCKNLGELADVLAQG